MKERILTVLQRHRLSALAGVLAGGLIAAAWLTWVVNFAPFEDDTSSLWSTSASPTETGTSTQHIYKPRYDDLMRRLQVDGRFGGLAWQNLQEVAEAWLIAQPVEALNHLIHTGGISLIDDALLSSAIESATKGNFAVALGLAEEIDSASVRARWTRRAFELLAIEDPASAFHALSTIPNYRKWDYTYILATTWAERDPQKAFETFLQGDAILIESIANVWAAKEPDAAVAFFLEAPPLMPSATGRNVTTGAVLDSIMRRLTRENPEKAFALLAQLPQAELRPYKMAAFGNLAKKDPAKALELAASVTEDLERLRTLSAIAAAAHAAGQQEFAETVYAQIPGERAKSNTGARRVWEGTHYETPDRAVPNLAKIGDPITHHDALHSIASVWLQKKPREFAKFVNEQAPSGNQSWIRAMADTLVDHGRYSVDSASTLREALSPEALAQLRQEIALQAFPGSSDDLLNALEAR